MADPKKMSIQEMLEAARASAGGGSKPKKEEPAPEARAEEAAAEAPKPEKKKAAPAAKAGGSVADILAAARASAGEPAAKEEAAEEAAEKPAKPAGKPASGKGMSVADMLAAARGEGKGAAAAPKEKAAPAAKKAAAEPKAKAESPAVEKAISPRDTTSILAAARKGDKAGPMSKAEAAGTAPEAKTGKAAKAPKVVPPMPEKPSYAKPSPAAKRTEDEESRRGFFGLLLGSYLAVGFTTLGLTNLLWTLGFARFMFPNILTEPPTRFKVGPPSNFAPGQVETKFVAQFGVWVVNTIYQGAQIIFALRTVCTHLGCTPNWLEAEQKFKCPCHGSGFYKDGVNFEGPAPRPLERYAISIAADGQLEIDKSKLFQEEKGQWSDPASKVPV